VYTNIDNTLLSCEIGR